jgi:hypothetical protein
MLMYRLKQMRLIHNKGYTQDEVEDFRYVIPDTTARAETGAD